MGSASSPELLVSLATAALILLKCATAGIAVIVATMLVCRR